MRCWEIQFSSVPGGIAGGLGECIAMLLLWHRCAQLLMFVGEPRKITQSILVVQRILEGDGVLPVLEK